MSLTLPNNIVNGQVIDATPVMGNFNALANAMPAGGANAAAAGANSDITSLSGLTTPLSTAQGGTGANLATTPLPVAQGGTGDNGSAWTTVAAGTPTPSSGAFGAGATSSVRYKRMGKTVWFQITATVPLVGTGTGAMTVGSLPFTFAGGNTQMVAGRENALNGKACIGIGTQSSASITIAYYDNSATPGANATAITVGGVAETT